MYAPVSMDLTHRRLTPDFTLYVSGGGINCVSCDIYVYHLLVCLCFIPGVFLSSRMTGACPATTDLIMQVNARTTKKKEKKIKDEMYADFIHHVLVQKLR